MRNPLNLFAEATGETLLAVDPHRLTAEAREGAATPGGGIAIVPLQGALSPRGVSWFGRQVAPGMDSFRSAITRAGADSSVGVIVLDVNTPGGTFAATPETGEALRRVAEQKRVVAVVDTLAASAGVFIIAQPGVEIAVTPSGEMGSLGVLSVHHEVSRMYDEAGITTTVIRSRAGKADVNPYEPLTPEARAAVEASVREADDEFLKSVARGRGMTVAQVRKLADEGGFARTVSARQAVAMGMADKVATMNEVLSSLVRTQAPTTRRRSSLIFD